MTNELASTPVDRGPGCCAKCGCAPSEEDRVLLWDGRIYCRSCVEVACPGMSGYARKRPELVETYDYSLWSFAWLLATLYLAVVGIFTFVILLGASAKHPGEVPFLEIFLGVNVLAVLAMSIQGPMLLLILMSGPPSVTVREGHIMVTRSGSRAWFGREFGSGSLSDCMWYVGRLRHDSKLGYALIANPPAVIIVFPGSWLFRNKVACGYTPEMRRIWEGFLTLTDIPRYK
jgi:hypothetical protein